MQTNVHSSLHAWDLCFRICFLQHKYPHSEYEFLSLFTGLCECIILSYNYHNLLTTATALVCTMVCGDSTVK